MRIHYSRQVTELLRSLGESGADLRRVIESLVRNPYPDTAMEIPERPGRYELFYAGRWIVYEVDESSAMETIIRVTAVE